MVNEALEAVRANLMRAVQKLFEQGNAAFAALRIYAMMFDVCERSADKLRTRSLTNQLMRTCDQTLTYSLMHTPTPPLVHALTRSNDE